MEGPVGGGGPIRAGGLHTDEGEHHNMMIPVLKKVKDKVKKMKDTIKKKYDHATDDDDDDEEEVEEDPEIHGAPNLGEDPGAPNGRTSIPGSYQTSSTNPTGGPEPDLIKSFQAISVSSDQPKKDEDQKKSSLPTSANLEEDPGAPMSQAATFACSPGSCQTNATGGPEPDLIKSFQAISVSSDQPKKDEDQKKSSLPTSADLEEDPGAPMSQAATFACSPGSCQTNATGGPEPGVIRSSTEEKHEEEEKVDPHHKDDPSCKEKATSIKDTVVSATTGGSGSGSTSSTEEDVGKVKQKQHDKGVSLREYLTEKLSPGEEDKALSEVISGSATATKKEKESNAASVLAEDEKEEEEVENQGVMGKIKSAVTSLLGGGGGGGGEPKKLQESSN